MFDRVFASNTKGAYLFGRAVATYMIKKEFRTYP